jgi:hypothetical protein
MLGLSDRAMTATWTVKDGNGELLRRFAFASRLEVGPKVVPVNMRHFVVPGRLWAALLNACGAFITAHTHTYHPERHYMRGPGPKCREKCERQNQRSAAAN